VKQATLLGVSSAEKPRNAHISVAVATELLPGMLAKKLFERNEELSLFFTISELRSYQDYITI